MKKFFLFLYIFTLAASLSVDAKSNKRRYITPEEVHVTVSPEAIRKANELYESVRKDYSQGKLSADAVVDKALYHKVWSPELAEKCLRLVSDKSARAKAELGSLYTYSKTAYLFPNMTTEGVKLMEEAAKAGNKEANDYLGIYYNSQKKYDMARRYFEVAAPNNTPFALSVIGEMYEKGNGVKKDRAKAREYFRRAAMIGDANGATKYGLALQRQWYGDVNMPDAFVWTYLAGELGGDVARSNLQLPLRGERFGDDKNTAFVRNALTLGDAWNDQYGHKITAEPIYQEGYKAGLDARIKAADKGDEWSLFYLGSMSFNGEFLKRSDDFVRKCYEPIIATGNLPDKAMGLVYERMAEIYRNNNGVTPDKTKASEYARKAARLGNLTAYKLVENIPD